MPVQALPERYCLDANVLISIGFYYPQSLRLLSKNAKLGRIVIPEGVKREVKRSSAIDLDTWESKYQAVIYVARNQGLKTELARIETAYGNQIVIGGQRKNGFWASPRGRHAADGQVVAVSKVLGCTAVSNDEAVQNACMIEGDVTCITWQEFHRRLTRDKSITPSLFGTGSLDP